MRGFPPVWEGSSDVFLTGDQEFRSKTPSVLRLSCPPVKKTSEQPVVERLLSGDQATQRRWRGPTYSDCGRMILLARRCSSACAIQPLVRLMANVGVNSAAGKPRPCSNSAV